MAIAMMTWLIAIPLLGVATGLRSMTPMAVLCWYSYLGYLPVDGTWADWTSRLWVAVLFTVLAVAEYAADKTSWIPNRISKLPLLVRVALGGLAGAIAATSLNEPGLEGVLLAVVGALLGSFGGFMVRRDLSQKLESAEWMVAVGEDLCTILCAIFAMHVVTS